MFCCAPSVKNATTNRSNIYPKGRVVGCCLCSLVEVPVLPELINDGLCNKNNHNKVNITHFFFVSKAITINFCRTRAGGGGRGLGEGLVVEE